MVWSKPQWDGPNNKNKQAGAGLGPQCEDFNEEHMELPRHTVRGNSIPLAFFPPSLAPVCPSVHQSISLVLPFLFFFSHTHTATTLFWFLLLIFFTTDWKFSGLLVDFLFPSLGNFQPPCSLCFKCYEWKCVYQLSLSLTMLTKPFPHLWSLSLFLSLSFFFFSLASPTHKSRPAVPSHWPGIQVRHESHG